MSNQNPFGTCMATGFTNGRVDLLPGVTASGIDVLTQSIVRRLFTPRGSAQDAPNDGIDIRTILKRGMTQTEVSQLPGLITNEILRDARVLPGTNVSAVLDQTNTCTITINGQSAAGPFTLTIQSNGITVALIQASQ